MTGQLHICPYTGLRSFTEEESLYFKGRDLQVDQITALLEQNKFLMVTGASGEGKSSLIYAGLIPNAKAGFFKAKYTNWVVADFRPERSPINNMADALAKTFHSQPSTVETELRRGFSSLVDLYTNSDYYIDESDEQWKKLGEPEKKERKRKAANLMIIVDQFEEFFTNPENFYNEAPSQDSQIVVNLVLETARIAIKRNIPVYVVCTMRSDYIGQCSAFRGLPEYIGFSQFFVPRLKRKDLKQVIEEPAILSGNRISQRLIERLVYDIADGVDQLPILQHALSQIWLVADQGNQEMDLVHYAKVGGMPVDELPDEEQPAFKEWFSTLTEVRQKYYKDTGLNKIIEIHASLLYENAWEYYNSKHPGSPLSQQDAKRIIALTFSCLTKIDNSRAVRNRMSLEEITGIINDPRFSTEVVGEVLSIYREEGNSFIRPFKTEDPATHHISASTVLDITHESLIRNWNKLNTWANQEFEYYSTFLDFKKQLDRWKASGKSRGFLLPIGPLTYFENWYKNCKPNVGWIRRYSDIQEDPVKANEDAENVLYDVRSFIKKSANKVAVTRAFMKYGAGRIATIVAVLAMIVLSGFYWYDAEQKQNSQVIKKIRRETATLMKSKELGPGNKTFPLLMEERYEPGYLFSFLNELKDKEKISLANESYQNVLNIDKHDTSVLRPELRKFIQANLKAYFAKKTDYPFLLTQLNKFTTLLAYDQYYNPSAETEKLLEDYTDEGYQLAMIFFGKGELYQATVPAELNYSIQQWLTHGHTDQARLDSMLQRISPMENAGNQALFDIYYTKGKLEINGTSNIEYNGGYHTLACLYAAKGETDKIIRCFELMKEAAQNDYFTATVSNNFSHVIAVCYQFGHRDKAGSIVKWLGEQYPVNTPLAVYKQMATRSGYINIFYSYNINKGAGYFFPNLCMARRELFNQIFDDYDKVINGIPNPSERNFQLAMNEKRRALFIHKYQNDRQSTGGTDSLNHFLSLAVDHYRLIDKNYLDGEEPVLLCYNLNGVRNLKIKRRSLFIYPDYMDGWFANTFHSDLFFNYIDQHNLFNELYTTSEDLGFIHLWIAKSPPLYPYSQQNTFDNKYKLEDKVLVKALDVIKTHPQGKDVDVNLIVIMLANRAFNKGDTIAGLNYYREVDQNKLAASGQKYEYLEKTYFLNELRALCGNLAEIGKSTEGIELARKFEKDHEQAFAYIYMAEKAYLKRKDPMAFVYLDSVFTKVRVTDFSLSTFDITKDYRFNLILLLSRIGGRDMNRLATNFLHEIVQPSQPFALINRVYGVSNEGNFYLARKALPSTLTEVDDLATRSIILWQACLKKEAAEGKPRWKAFDEGISHDINYVNFVPN